MPHRLCATEPFWAQKLRSAIKAADAGPSETDLAEAPILTYWRELLPICWTGSGVN
ncbi:DUF6634 family protein [Albirhodobacter sp. R86504]|uniref:DUF6634 family protein n=1 Tax=Albirhodobacter sp. R86504 TaxID=3093848 RepID=UPI00366E24A1